MVVTTPLTITPPPTCDNYKAKKCILEHISPHHDLDPLPFEPKMRPSLPQSPLAVKFWSNSVNKHPRYLANNVCSGLAHAWTREHSGNTMFAD